MQRTMSWAAVPILIVTLAGGVEPARAFSYSLLRTHTPPPPAPVWYGFSTASLGGKIVVGSPLAGKAYLYDAATGALLQTFQAPASSGANDLFGYSVAIVAPSYTLITANIPYVVVIGA